MNDNFKKQPHHLIYEELLQQGITLGITTRGDGLSDYPKNAFNMARYIDDRPYNITQHQLQLAEEIAFDRKKIGCFPSKHMKIKSLVLQRMI